MSVLYDSDGASDPCLDGRREVEALSRAAAELAETARRRMARLRHARQERLELEASVDGNQGLVDRQAIDLAKRTAHHAYRERYRRARDRREVQAAAADWLREIDRLNRRARLRADAADALNRRRAELDAKVSRFELAADAARVAAEAAQLACLEARHRLAVCEESALLRRAAGSPSAATGTRNTAATPVDGRTTVLGALLAGDERTLAELAGRLAPDLGGMDRARHLLLQLRGSLLDSALASDALAFPPRHRFWSQFAPSDARLVASALRSLGNGFDGTAGWSRGHPADVRQLASALAYVGYEARAIRHPAAGHEIEELWRGTTVDAVDHVAHRAPGLTVEELVKLLGSDATPLAELWDRWGRIRPLLLAAAAEASPRAPGRPGETVSV